MLEIQKMNGKGTCPVEDVLKSHKSEKWSNAMQCNSEANFRAEGKKSSSPHTSASPLIRVQFRRCHGVWCLLLSASSCFCHSRLFSKMHFCRFNRWNGAPIEGNMCQSYLHPLHRGEEDRRGKRSRKELMSSSWAMMGHCCWEIFSHDIFGLFAISLLLYLM